MDIDIFEQLEAVAKSDSNDESMDVKFMSEDPVQLKKAFRNLYTKFGGALQPGCN